MEAMVSNSLRSGEPLPQITPSPLLDRFIARRHGLNIIHEESEEDYGLPRMLTIDTLKDEQYLWASFQVMDVCQPRCAEAKTEHSALG